MDHQIRDLPIGVSALTTAPRPFGDATYAGVVSERNQLRRCLLTQAKMLAGWGAECFPAATNGQVHFARAIMESAAQEMTDVMGLPYPVPDAKPASNPVAGLIALLASIEHTLNTVNGVFASDSISTSGGDVIHHWQIDVAPDLNALGAMLGRLRELPA